MAKKVDPLKAKAAKQKKIAIGLSVMFVAVLAFQGPKTLKMLKGPATAPVETAAPTTPVTSTTATGAVPPGTPGAPVAAAAGAPATAGEAQPAVLVDSDLPVTAGAGQLLSFERFDAVDPFDQQVDPNAIPPAPSTGKSAAAASTKAAAAAAAGGKTGSVVPGAGAAGDDAPAGSTVEVQLAATTTTLALNGAVIELVPAAEFPAELPVFVFVSAALDGKSIEIGIAGGTYADGDDTITLKVGKPLTLQNTSDGSRYELELLTVAGFVTPKPKK